MFSTRENVRLCGRQYNNIMTDLSCRLKELRKARGLSQKNFAESLGVVPRTYQRYESGERTIPSDVLQRLSEIGVSVHWLLTGNGKMNAPLQEEMARLEALVNYWEANYMLLEANINKARVVIKDRYGENVAAELCDEALPTVGVSIKFPHPAGKEELPVAVAEKSKSKATTS